MTAMTFALYKQLGCRDFSLFDFRINRHTGQPYLLEAGLFWSFSEESFISSMLRPTGTSLQTVTQQLWTQAAQRSTEIPALEEDLPVP
jgi:D-alanine-D-alanine ligase